MKILLNNSMNILKTTAFLVLLIVLFAKCTAPNKTSQADFDTIVSDFKTPTDENTLWCYWYWIGDDISKEGITKDLESMKAAGIGAAFIGNINPEEKDGPVPMLSEEWWSHMVHAVNEGKRLGVDIGSFNCPGWSMSGGPWITSEMAMRHIVYSETTVSGGKKVVIQLEKPKKEFQDVYVLAFPKNAVEGIVLDNTNSKISSTPAIKNAKKLIDGNFEESIKFTSDAYTIDIIADQPITARSIKLYTEGVNLIVNCELQAFVGNKYISVKEFTFDRRDFKGQTGPIALGPLFLSLPEIKSDKFRLICKDIKVSAGFVAEIKKSYGFSEILISEAPVLQNYLGKTLGRMHPTPYLKADTYVWESSPEIKNKDLIIAQEGVLDISDKMDAQGNLNWDPPEGEWTVMRF